MARVKGGTISRARHKKVMKMPKVILVVNIDYIVLHMNK